MSVEWRLMEGIERLVDLWGETPNVYGGSWFGREFTKFKGHG